MLQPFDDAVANTGGLDQMGQLVAGQGRQHALVQAFLGAPYARLAQRQRQRLAVGQRILDALEAADVFGQGPVHQHRGLKRVKDALAEGKPLPVALREARVWGAKERLYERVLPALAGHQLAHLVEAASTCDGVIKGLKHPDWPLDAWAALKRLMLLTLQQVAGSPAPARGAAPARLQLALQP